jgi:hypothetical protein
MVGDLVIADQVGIDDRAPGADVAHHRGHDDVPLYDRGERSDQGIQHAAADRWALVAPPLAYRGHQLAHHLGDEGEHRAGRAGRVREVGEVPRAVTSTGTAGHAQHEGRVARAASEQVAPAGAVGSQQAGPVGVPPLQPCRSGRPATRHQPSGVLFEPAERGNVVVGTVQDGELAGAGLAAPVGLPRDEAMRTVGQPAGDRR